jgi:hypothetical protein
MSAAAVPGGANDAQAVEAWAQYAKERFDAGEKRLADFRSWARQLAAAVGVAIGLEAALIGQVLKLEEESRAEIGVCLIPFLATVAWQLVVMGRAVAAGYVGKQLLVAESPVVVWGHLAGRDQASTRQMIGAYYANSSDTVHRAAEDVAIEVRRMARDFRWSLWLLFGAMVLTAGIAAASHTRKAMSDTPAAAPGPSEPVSPAVAVTPSPAASAPAAPPQASPAATPMLVTPTPGQTETHGAPVPEHGPLATPTPGQTLTEGIEYRKK